MKIPFISLHSFSSMKGIGPRVCPYLTAAAAAAQSVARFIVSRLDEVIGLGIFAIGVGFAYQYRKEIGDKISSLWGKCFAKQPEPGTTAASVVTEALKKDTPPIAAGKETGEKEFSDEARKRASEHITWLLKKRKEEAASTMMPPAPQELMIPVPPEACTTPSSGGAYAPPPGDYTTPSGTS